MRYVMNVISYLLLISPVKFLLLGKRNGYRCNMKILNAYIVLLCKTDPMSKFDFVPCISYMFWRVKGSPRESTKGRESPLVSILES